MFNENELYSVLLSNNFSKIDDFLTKYGINSVDRDNRSLLMSAVVERKMSVIEYLIEKDSNLNLQDKNGMTALHLAAMHDYAEIVEYLISKEAMVDAEDSNGNTPLWRAAMELPKEAKSIAVLLENGADITKQNKYQISPEDLLSDE
ncbi:ankyrin repeat domain-containing protein [Listeria monocytogenes]|uniref:ankyrin repeat domain-containing protein n=1 Tax=Listeria monocytogenes TaxID=1639 RepID=UPI0008738FA2|nr:ankyrin repeat domain-containing protein [Listeria monocytogenes]EAC3818518.1 ankyrin repeat domain-containing protein [Listeria monocytogenes]EAD0589098.1 ankyrin repeat domain-containing protein [Listeria monocytogenes]ECP9717519.1 ankyrin repeat domain-containing protein [Listeria monocytogenes]ECQ6205570.1 ankyrin repeat domain-containing protein [Listeria monocytogenes]EDN7759213.1 ankyrin repeat domain-containing protein [Listeria monocytogenes]